MKRAQKALIIILSVIILSAGNLHAETVPMLINYKGRIYHEDILWNGPGYFKFAIVNTASTADTIAAATYWSNDGTSDCSTGDADLCEPDSAVRVPVNEGVFYIKLGDTGITNMSPITKAAFSDDITYIRVWFSISETDQFELLEPDRQIVSVPYAIYSETSETANQLVNTGADSGLDADTVDGLHASDISSEIDSDISTHSSNASAHHTKTTSFTELTDKISDNQIPADIARDSEVNKGGTGSGLDADLLDGKDSSAFISADTDKWVDTTGDTMTGDLTVEGYVTANKFIGKSGEQLAQFNSGFYSMALGESVLIQFTHLIKTPNGTNFNGTGMFKFAILDPKAEGLGGDPEVAAKSLWSNDGTSDCSTGNTDACQPDTYLTATVTNGSFLINLDEFQSPPLPVNSGIFENPDLVMRVWYDDTTGFDRLLPDTPLIPDRDPIAVPFAITAENAKNADRLGGIPADNYSIVSDSVISQEEVNFNYAGSDSKGGDATNAKTADNVDWSGITNMPADFSDGTDDIRDHALDAADGNPTEAVYVDNVGNVGIGTTTPSAKLDVAGNITASPPTASNHVATKTYVDAATNNRLATEWQYWGVINSTEAFIGISTESIDISDNSYEYLIFTSFAGPRGEFTVSPPPNVDVVIVETNVDRGQVAYYGAVQASSCADHNNKPCWTFMTNEIISIKKGAKWNDAASSTSIDRGSARIKGNGKVYIYDNSNSGDRAVLIYRR